MSEPVSIIQGMSEVRPAVTRQLTFIIHFFKFSLIFIVGIGDVYRALEREVRKDCNINDEQERYMAAKL